MRRLQPAIDDAARVAAPSRLGEEGDNRGLGDDACRLDREQFRIARPDADAVQAAGAHSASLASALTAAAAIALPPLRPRTTIEGSPLPISASFEFRRADEADRHADDRGRARRAGADQFEQAEERGRGVADRDDRACEPRQPEVDRRCRPGRPEPCSERRSGRIGERADDVVAGGQAGAGDAFGDHACVAEN